MQNKIEPTVMLLFFGMVFFTFVLFASEVWFASDSQLFQVIASLLTGFSGAFFMRVKPGRAGAPGPTGDQGATGATGPTGKDSGE